MDLNKFNEHVNTCNDDIDRIARVANSGHYILILILNMLMHIYKFLIDAERDKVK